MLGQITQLGVDSEHTKREANCAYLMISIGSIFTFLFKSISKRHHSNGAFNRKDSVIFDGKNNGK